MEAMQTGKVDTGLGKANIGVPKDTEAPVRKFRKSEYSYGYEHGYEKGVTEKKLENAERKVEDGVREALYACYALCHDKHGRAPTHKAGSYQKICGSLQGCLDEIYRNK